MPDKKPNDGSEKAFHELSDHELLDIMAAKGRDLLRRHGLHVLFGIAVILLVVVFFQWLGARREEKQVAGQKALATQQPLAVLEQQIAMTGWTQGVQRSYDEMVKNCLDIIGEGPSTASAAWARLRLAHLYGMKQDWDKAEEQYDAVLSAQDEPALANAALAGKAAVTEELAATAFDDQGNVDEQRQAELFVEAAAIYKELGKSLRFYLADAGRCLEMAGKVDEARSLYSSLAEDEDGDSQAAFFAEERLKAISRGERYILTPPPRVAAPTVAQPTMPDYGDIDIDVPADTEVEPAPETSVAPDTSVEAPE